MWTRRYNGPADSDDSAYAIGVDSASHDMYVTGASTGSTGDDFATVKYGANGATLGAKRYAGPAHGADQAYAVAVDSVQHRAYVTGASEVAGGVFDYATVGYGTPISQLWTGRYNGTGTAPTCPSRLRSTRAISRCTSLAGACAPAARTTS